MNNIFNHSHFQFIKNELFIKKDWLENVIEIEKSRICISIERMNQKELIAYHLDIIKAIINGMDEGR